jgi:LDH2 family malate/lactate/ureidoglycolate dehydrogenase
MTQNSVIVNADVERQFGEAALLTTGMPAADAALVADTLVEADLRGVYSHGIQLLHRYVRGLSRGLNPNPNVQTVVDAGALAILDGDCGMGQVASRKAMDLAIEKAEEHGIAAVGVRNSNHHGALAYWGMMAVDRGMIGIATTNGPAMMAPAGGVTETLGNNPVCYAMPAGKAYPIILDMAVSTAARNKIRVAAAAGTKIPLDWALDRDGRPTDDPDVALAGLVAPMSGAKGFGMAVVMEILTAGLSGGLMGKDVPTDTITGADSATVFHPVRASHHFQVIDVKRIVPLDEFKSRVDRLAEQVHESALAKGKDAVYMPGEIEFKTKERRLREGIPILPAVMGTLDRIADEIGIERIARL